MFHGVTDDTLARGNALLGNTDVAARLRQRALHTYHRIGATWWRERLDTWRAEPATGTRRHFRRAEGGVWTIGLDTAPVAIPAMRGLDYLHHLLSRPGADVAALDLVGAYAGHAVVEQPGTGDTLDRRALIEYRRRIAELDAGPPTAAAASERAALQAQVRAATGLGGRARTTGSSSERARVAVRKAIVGALARIADLDQDLGRHLYERISTGTTCRYDPDARVHWVL